MTRPITVIIREIREKVLLVDTDSIEDAKDTVEYLYSDGNFVLTNDDIEDVEFLCQEEDLED